MSLWDGLFQHMGQPIAQILLTKNDIADVRITPRHLLVSRLSLLLQFHADLVL
jgi:glutamate 5-kinase